MKRLFMAGVWVSLLALVYHRFMRRAILDWGARPEEVEAILPGDELLPEAGTVATRAIGIDAPPSAIWPWLLQMGPGRGGAYTYDWIENLFGLNMHSADRIVPEWQSMKVGDVWRNPQGVGMRTEIVDPERTLALRAEDGSWVWSFNLLPDGESTRFISRNRFIEKGGLLERAAGEFLMLPGSLVMERKMLFGFKSRAECLARERADAAVRRSVQTTQREPAAVVAPRSAAAPKGRPAKAERDEVREPVLAGR